MKRKKESFHKFAVAPILLLSTIVFNVVMPTISMFFGIIIRMYYAPKEHNPPHVHAYYQEFKATFSIENCELIKGDIPSKQIRLIQAWMEIHQEELKADWELCQNGEKPFKIEPLK